MNSKTKLILVLFFIITNTLSAQKTKHTFGWAYDIEKDESSVYFNDPYNVWGKMRPTINMEVFYLYEVNKYMKFGSYLEMTKAELDILWVPDYDAFRWNVGVQCLGHYPDWILQWQYGAYGGLGIGVSEEWDDNYLGTDYGIIVGPGLEYKNIGIALHLHAGYSIFVSNGEPEKIWLHDRRLYIKAYYNL